MHQDVVPLSGLSIRATFVNLKAHKTNRLTGRTRMNAHKNARSCPLSRELLVKRVSEQGWSVRAASEAVGMSDRRGREWMRRAAGTSRSCPTRAIVQTSIFAADRGAGQNIAIRTLVL
jgi:transposase IS481 family protein